MIKIDEERLGKYLITCGVKTCVAASVCGFLYSNSGSQTAANKVASLITGIVVGALVPNDIADRFINDWVCLEPGDL